MKDSLKKYAVLLLFTATLSAQDFGYDYYNVTDYRSLGVNYSLQDFSARSSNNLPDSLRIKFSTNLSSIEYRELGVRLAVGYQEYLLGGRTKTSLSVYAESGRDFPLSGKADRSGLFLPVIVSANYVKAEALQIGAKNFDIGSFGIGAGLRYRYFTRSLGVQAGGTAAFHYSTEGFSTEYGTSTSFAGEVMFVFPELFLGGVVAGYRFQSQLWNMSDPQLDYQRYYHGPFVGIMF